MCVLLHSLYNVCLYPHCTYAHSHITHYTPHTPHTLHTSKQAHSHSTHYTPHTIKLLTHTTHSFRQRAPLHLDVCSRPDILEQVICITHSPSFTTQEAQAAMCVMACAAQSKELHKWLCRTNVLEGICDVFNVRRKMAGTRPKDLGLLW